MCFYPLLCLQMSMLVCNNFKYVFMSLYLKATYNKKPLVYSGRESYIIVEYSIIIYLRSATNTFVCYYLCAKPHIQHPYTRWSIFLPKILKLWTPPSISWRRPIPPSRIGWIPTSMKTPTHYLNWSNCNAISNIDK